MIRNAAGEAAAAPPADRAGSPVRSSATPSCRRAFIQAGLHAGGGDG